MTEQHPTLLAYYYDADAKNKLPTDAQGNFKVDFGKRVDSMGNFKVSFGNVEPPRAGIDSIYQSIYVKNVHHYPMELRPVTLDKDLTITEYPEFLEPDEIGKVTLAFSPSEDRIKPLEGGSWDFEKIVLPKL